MFWLCAGWTAYVEHYPEGPLPKFDLPLWFQIAPSAILIGTWSLIAEKRLRRTMREE